MNARQYDTRYDKMGSTYEYQRALMIDPSNLEARLAYANILEMNGMHELYLTQLNFIKENSEKELSSSLKDTIEAYDSLLEKTLAKKWKVDPFYLDKIRWNIAVFYTDTTSSFNHADSERLIAQACADVFSGVAITSVKTQVTPVSGYAEAFKNARANNFDYFVIVSLSEGLDDLTLTSKMYSGRTGTVTSEEKFYATIPEWLYLVDNAEYVVTNSFHCAVFSTIFHKSFGVIKLTGDMESNNARFDSLFELRKIEPRYITELDLTVLEKPYTVKDITVSSTFLKTLEENA